MSDWLRAYVALALALSVFTGWWVGRAAWRHEYERRLEAYDDKPCPSRLELADDKLAAGFTASVIGVTAGLAAAWATALAPIAVYVLVLLTRKGS